MRRLRAWSLAAVVLVAAVCAPPPRVLAAASPAGPQLLQEFNALDARLSAAERKLDALAQQRREQSQRLSASRSARAGATLRLRRARAALGMRLGVLARRQLALRYRISSGAKSVSEFVDDHRLLAAVARYDHALWSDVARAKSDLDDAISQQQQAQQALAQMTQHRRRVRDELAMQRRRRAEMLVSLKKEDGSAKGFLQALVQDQAESRVAAALPLAWPAPGNIKKRFGQKVELSFGTTTQHNGVDIAAAAGTRVRAVAPGEVVWAQWLKGFGQVVIVAHAQGVHSVLAHLSKIHVRRGQSVGQGDTVGLVGDSGSTRGTVLYFEVRQNGVPQDPLSFVQAGT